MFKVLTVEDAASAINIIRDDIRVLIDRLDEVVADVRKINNELEECVRQNELTHQLEKLDRDLK